MDHRVLVVDDDSLLRRIIGLNLTKRGLLVREASSCETAVYALADAAPDVLILDLNLPDGDGREVLRELHRRGFNIPTLVMTAAPMPPGFLGDLRPQSFLRKPFVIETLLERVWQAMPAAPETHGLGQWLGELRTACKTLAGSAAHDVRSLSLLLPPPLADRADPLPIRLAESLTEEYDLSARVEFWQGMIRVQLTRRAEPQRRGEGVAR
jgi:two-component system, OmpR family, KDP operon response regulator KdpE